MGMGKDWLWKVVPIVVTIVGATWYLANHIAGVEGRTSKQAHALRTDLIDRTTRIEGNVVRVAESINRSVIPSLEKLGKQTIPPVQLSELQKQVRERDEKIAFLHKELRTLSGSMAATRSQVQSLTATWEVLPTGRVMPEYEAALSESKIQLEKIQGDIGLASSTVDSLAVLTSGGMTPTKGLTHK